MAWSRYLSLSVALLATLWALKGAPGGVDEGSLLLPSGSDPEYSVDLSPLDQAISCPTYVEGPKGVVLLVHGTGVTPQMNWDHTVLPPLIEHRFQPCYVAVPQRLLLDGQRSAEFVSYAIKKVANDYPSSGGVSIISWSAGALVTQWTLTFYPETRAVVKQHIALGPSYRGSWMMAPLFYLNRYSESVVQQLPWSSFLTALRNFGGTRAIVPTTNIGSSTDQVVQPGFLGEWLGGYHDAWRLSGPLASNIDLFKVCLPSALSKGSLPRFFTHESLLWEAASHRLIFDALKNSETFVGNANAIKSGDCGSRLAPGLKAEWEEEHAGILPELFKYAQTLELDGWPEVPLRDYATRT